MRCASFDLLFDDTTHARAAVRTGVKRAGANFVTIAEDAAERQTVPFGQVARRG